MKLSALAGSRWLSSKVVSPIPEGATSGIRRPAAICSAVARLFSVEGT